MYRAKYTFMKGSAGDSLGAHHYLANFSTYDKASLKYFDEKAKLIKQNIRNYLAEWDLL